MQRFEDALLQCSAVVFRIIHAFSRVFKSCSLVPRFSVSRF